MSDFDQFEEEDAMELRAAAALMDRYASDQNARLQQTELFGTHDRNYKDQVTAITAERDRALAMAAYLRDLVRRLV